MGVGCCGCYNFRTLSAVVAHAFLPRILYCKSKAGRKNLSLYTGSLARTNFSQAVFGIADCNARIPAFAIRESSGAERLVNGVSLQVFTSDALLQRLL